MVYYNEAWAWLATIALGITLLGCGSSDSSTGGASMDELAGQVSAQRSAEQAKTAEEEAAKAAAEAPAQPPAEPPRKVAERPGAGQGGYYTAIVGARRHVLNRVDDLAWVQGVQHFQAEHGRLPKDHAEFMSKIVEPLGIDLGYKQENEEFLYDPTAGQWGEVYVVEKLDQPAQ